ncbi:cysteine dioxygenase family protein [Paenibacillus filicis]|uniref:Cysteine dioxygenase family protein n=1 Tax=Paenibacillus gyeongsangnamensis TaxID=3388067 RepID=A0ABT4QKT1_9BACL|nr:cysteine dioxygenase family protein [Paenibacillus filicis]MCZ8517417.1 cysteine dioxygenase family protein [Paenibacillus filicis]
MNLCDAVGQTLSGLRTYSPAELMERIRKLRITAEVAAPWVAEPQRLPYGRTSLYLEEGVEAVLIHLPGGAATHIHDHGASIGCARVLEGRMLNRIFRLDGYGYPEEAGEYEVREGEFLIAPRGQIHQMVNPSMKRMISFHLYAPRMSASRKYVPYEQALDYVI